MSPARLRRRQYKKRQDDDLNIAEFIPQFGGVVWILLAFVVALSIIVAVHEYGHYIVGRWTGIKADVFSLGFGPVLWSRHDKRGTKWQIAALPFGGYVKFAGDANAASGKDVEGMEALADDPQALRATMHGAPLWARTLTVAAGPVFNFILSAIIFTGVLMVWGVSRDDLIVDNMRPMPGEVQTLQEGDDIRAISGVPVPVLDGEDSYKAFVDALPVEPVMTYDIIRDGQPMQIDGPYLQAPIVDRVMPRSAAYYAGLQAGDVITAIDGSEIFAFEQLQKAVEGSDGRELALDIWRAGEMLKVPLKAKVIDDELPDGGFEKKLRIGVGGGLVFEPKTERPGIGQAIGIGVQSVWRIITGSLSGLKHMIAGQISTCNLNGPVGIAQTSGAMASAGLEDFIYFIAVISTAVGLVNLFPVPMLDGGHLIFYAYEAVAGRPPSDRALRVLMAIGLTMVLSLMLFALGNDLFCP